MVRSSFDLLILLDRAQLNGGFRFLLDRLFLAQKYERLNELPVELAQLIELDGIIALGLLVLFQLVKLLRYHIEYLVHAQIARVGQALDGLLFNGRRLEVLQQDGQTGPDVVTFAAIFSQNELDLLEQDGVSDSLIALVTQNQMKRNLQGFYQPVLRDQVALDVLLGLVVLVLQATIESEHEVAGIEELGVLSDIEGGNSDSLLTSPDLLNPKTSSHYQPCLS